MQFSKLLFIIFIFWAHSLISQKMFSSIDTLLFKTFKTVNDDDTIAYLSFVNLPYIFKDKNLQIKKDSILALKPFTEAFTEILDELKELAAGDEINIKYDSYDPLNSREFNATVTGKILVHVKLIVNNTFTVKIPFSIAAYNGLYTIESPFMIMFVDN